MTEGRAIGFVRRHGVVLMSARGPAPTLADTIAGEPIRGSWWSHPKSHLIFRLCGAVQDAPGVLVCRLVDGKVTFVHRRLWPALVRLSDDLPKGRLASVRQIHTKSGRHETIETPFPRWVPAAVRREACRLARTRAVAALGAPLVAHLTGAAPAGPPLTPASFRRGLRALVEGDPGLGRIVARLGPPPMWTRPEGFPTLVHLILEQQVSLASARAAFDRLRAAASPLPPARLLALDDGALERAGFSRQKIVYARELARAVGARRPDLRSLGSLDDEAVRGRLTAIKGIGRWTADIYLLMALRRPDVWPAGDGALATAVGRALRLSRRPTIDELDAIGRRWRPFRAIAARILWHYYLRGGGRLPRAAPMRRRPGVPRRVAKPRRRARARP